MTFVSFNPAFYTLSPCWCCWSVFQKAPHLGPNSAAHINISKPIFQCSFDISVSTMRGRSTERESAMKAMKQSSIWTSNTEGAVWRRWYVGPRCQEGAVSWLHFQSSRGNPTHVATTWQHTSSHYPRGSLPSICSCLWRLDLTELVQRGFQSSSTDLKDGKMIIFSVCVLTKPDFVFEMFNRLRNKMAQPRNNGISNPCWTSAEGGKKMLNGILLH